MKINKIKHKAKDSNFYSLRYDKSKILLAGSLSTGMSHMKRLKYVENGNSKKFPAFTIDREGNVFQHFNPAFYADFTGNLDFDRNSIVIVLDNAGWLKQEFYTGKFLNWAKEEIPESCVVERKWREYNLWESYSDEQYESLIKLLLQLTDKFPIPRNFVGHNASEDHSFKINGILSRSNLFSYYTDLNPAFDFNMIMDEVKT